MGGEGVDGGGGDGGAAGGEGGIGVGEVGVGGGEGFGEMGEDRGEAVVFVEAGEGAGCLLYMCQRLSQPSAEMGE